MTNRLAILVGGLLLFSLAHTALASTDVQSKLQKHLGRWASRYRLLYNLLALAILVCTLLLARGPFPTLWHTEGGLRLVLLAIQGIALTGLIWTLRRFDLGHFIGWSQIRHRPERGGLQTTGPYGLCRHPLYLFANTFFSAWPLMDLRLLVLALWMWAYSYIGSHFEEAKLEHTFGEAYRRYRDTHWRFLPLGSRRAS